MRIEILLFDGFDELDGIGPYEVLRTAARLGADFDVALVTSDGQTQVTRRTAYGSSPRTRWDDRTASSCPAADGAAGGA